MVEAVKEELSKTVKKITLGVAQKIAATLYPPIAPDMYRDTHFTYGSMHSENVKHNLKLEYADVVGTERRRQLSQAGQVLLERLIQDKLITVEAIEAFYLHTDEERKI